MAGGWPEITGTRGAATDTENAGSAASAAVSLTLMTMFAKVPIVPVGGVPDSVPVAVSKVVHDGAFATRKLRVVLAPVTVTVGRNVQATPATAAVIGAPEIVREPVTCGVVGWFASATTVSVKLGPATVVMPSVTARRTAG